MSAAYFFPFGENFKSISPKRVERTVPWHLLARYQLALFGNWLVPRLDKVENDELERPTMPWLCVWGGGPGSAQGRLYPEFTNLAVTWDHTLAIFLFYLVLILAPKAPRGVLL